MDIVQVKMQCPHCQGDNSFNATMNWLGKNISKVALKTCPHCGKDFIRTGDPEVTAHTRRVF